ncbi:MAG: CPBP family intramembrane metalloprotease, partial [Thiotrichales bacterium]|nr:CPBP family intramembrane metalloprotease [Thiotrichales bacterium]
MVLGIHQIEPQLDYSVTAMARLILLAALAGVIIGIAEETIFRGAIQGVLMKHLHHVLAIGLTALVYAGLHFIKFPELPADMAPAWHNGLYLLGDSFKAGYFQYNFDKFITLLLLGILLGMLRAIQGNIALCIGVHAGLVMMMKISRKVTDYAPDTSLDFLVNYTDHQLGHLSSIVLLLVIFIIYMRQSTVHSAADVKHNHG